MIDFRYFNRHLPTIPEPDEDTNCTENELWRWHHMEPIEDEI